MPFSVGRKANVLMARIVLFAKLNFATRCESGICATPSNTRIFASDFQFGEFRAILRGVFVKIIHIFRPRKQHSFPEKSHFSECRTMAPVSRFHLQKYH